MANFDDKRDKQPHTLTPKDNLETPIYSSLMNWTCLFSDSESNLGVEPGALSLWGDSAKHHTTTSDIIQVIGIKVYNCLIQSSSTV